MSTEDPRCPECGGRIGQTATYCMHCQADLSDGEDDWIDGNGGESAGWDDDLDPVDEQTARTRPGGERNRGRGSSDAAGETGSADPGTGDAMTSDFGQVLDPDGVVDNTLTGVVGVVGGIVVGVVGTIALLFLTGSGFALLLGFVAWIAATVHLVRRDTVQGAISRSAYAVAVVLLLVPFVTLSPAVSVDGGWEERLTSFLVLLLFVSLPVLISVGVGYVAGRFTPN